MILFVLYSYSITPGSRIFWCLSGEFQTITEPCFSEGHTGLCFSPLWVQSKAQGSLSHWFLPSAEDVWKDNPTTENQSTGSLWRQCSNRPWRVWVFTGRVGLQALSSLFPLFLIPTPSGWLSHPFAWGDPGCGNSIGFESILLRWLGSMGVVFSGAVYLTRMPK